MATPSALQTATIADMALSAALFSCRSKPDRECGDFNLQEDAFANPLVLQDFTKALQASSSLTTLNLGGSKFDTSSEICRFFSFLESNESVVELDLSNCSFSCDKNDMQLSTCLRRLLQRNSTILKLDLSGHAFNEAQAAELAQGLQDNKTLRELKLVSCSLTESSASLLLKASAHILQALDLTANGPFSSDFLNIDVALYLHGNKDLQSLTLGHSSSMFAERVCGSEQDLVNSIRFFLLALQGNKTLRNLSFRFCRMREDVVQALLQTLTVNQTLHCLDLEFTGFALRDTKGHEILVELLPQMRGLRTLQLITCRCPVALIPQLEAALAQNTSMERFRPNLGGDVGAQGCVQSLLLRNRNLNQVQVLMALVPCPSLLPVIFSQWSQSAAGSSAIFEVLKQRIDECSHKKR